MNRFDEERVKAVFGVDNLDWNYEQWCKGPIDQLNVVCKQHESGYTYFLLNRGTSFLSFNLDPQSPSHSGGWVTQGINPELAMVLYKGLYLLGCEEELDGFLEQYGLSVSWTEKIAMDVRILPKASYEFVGREVATGFIP